MTNVVRGKVSTFGGPDDKGVAPDEGLALVSNSDVLKFSSVLLAQQPPGTTGLARRLNPNNYYIACRWNEVCRYSNSELQEMIVTVKNPVSGLAADARPVDWGPNATTAG